LARRKSRTITGIVKSTDELDPLSVTVFADVVNKKGESLLVDFLLDTLKGKQVEITITEVKEE